MTGMREDPGFLTGLTVVDAGAEATAFLGRMLADLGARVVVPGDAEPWPAELDGPDVRAFRDATALGKTLSIETTAEILPSAGVLLVGQRVAGAAHVIEGLQRTYPSLVIASVTAFGVSGPDASRPASDLTALAQSAYLHMTGPEDGPPLKPSVPFVTWRHACNHGLVGLLLALRRRRLGGVGSHVDIAARDTGLWMLTHTYQYWDMERVNLRRKGASRDVGKAGVRIPSVYPCKDGTIIWMILSGQLGKGSIDRLVEWMATEGHASEALRAIDWETLQLETIPDIDAFMAPFARFFLTKTRNELLERAIVDGFMIAPVADMEDLLDDPQLAFRGSWSEVDGVRLPRAPLQATNLVWGPDTAASLPRGEESVD